MFNTESPVERKRQRKALLEELKRNQTKRRSELCTYVSTFTSFLVYFAVVTFTYYYSTSFGTFIAFFAGLASLIVAYKANLFISSSFNVIVATALLMFLNATMFGGNAIQNLNNLECKDNISLFEVIIKTDNSEAVPPRCSQLGTEIYEGASSASNTFGFDLITWVFVEFFIYLGVFAFFYFGIWFLYQGKYGYWEWPDKLTDKLKQYVNRSNL